MFRATIKPTLRHFLADISRTSPSLARRTKSLEILAQTSFSFFFLFLFFLFFFCFCFLFLRRATMRTYVAQDDVAEHEQAS